MSKSLDAKFATRREAELTVERLVQQFDIERTDIFITTEGGDNSAGVEVGGADQAAAEPSPEERDDAGLHGAILVSVDLEDDALAAEVRAVFAEFHASDVAES